MFIIGFNALFTTLKLTDCRDRSNESSGYKKGGSFFLLAKQLSVSQGQLRFMII
jgi:hypothetical protein